MVLNIELKERKVQDIGHWEQEVEEEIELLYFDLEYPRCNEVAPFVYDNQNREAQ